LKNEKSPDKLPVFDAEARGGTRLQSGETWMEVKALHRHGWTVSALAREFGVCRDTVRRELRRDGPARYVRDKPTELTPAQLVHIERRLAAWRDDPGHRPAS
jgi:IS30 family transposase